MLKRIGLGLIVATVAGSAMAADLPVKRSPVLKAPVASPAFNWSGFYVGVHGGVAWADNTIIDHDGFANEGVLGHETDFDATGGIFGGQVGYNWQSGQLVFGLEGDMSYVSSNASSDKVDPVGLDETVRTKYQWLATIRGRLGIAVDRALIYATGGVAFAHIRNSMTDLDGAAVDPDDSFTSSATRTGWVVGGGFEYAFAPNWTLRAEGLYMDFGGRDYIVDTSVPTVPDTPTTNSRYTIESTVGVVRAGLTYRFGAPSAPVTARY